MQIDISELKEYYKRDDVKIFTDSGYELIIDTIEKEKEIIELHFDNYSILKVSADHLFELEDGTWKFSVDVSEDDKIKTKIGISKIVNKFFIGKEKTYDLTVDTEKHQYFLNGISSHNTGKTYLSKAIVDSIMSKNMTCAVIAPTHQAVGVIKDSIDLSHKNLHFATVHAFLGLKPGDIDPKTGERKFKKDTSKKASLLSKLKVDIVILDESSMIGEELYKFIKKEIFEMNRIKAILFLGDPYQLGPIEA